MGFMSNIKRYSAIKEYDSCLRALLNTINNKYN